MYGRVILEKDTNIWKEICCFLLQGKIWDGVQVVPPKSRPVQSSPLNAAGPRQHNRSWFRAPSGPMTILLRFRGVTIDGAWFGNGFFDTPQNYK
jgi:hypothetical protein